MCNLVTALCLVNHFFIKMNIVSFQQAFPVAGISLLKELISDLLKECWAICFSAPLFTSIYPSVMLTNVSLLCHTIKEATNQFLTFRNIIVTTISPGH